MRISFGDMRVRSCLRSCAISAHRRFLTCQLQYWLFLFFSFSLFYVRLATHSKPLCAEIVRVFYARVAADARVVFAASVVEFFVDPGMYRDVLCSSIRV